MPRSQIAAHFRVTAKLRSTLMQNIGWASVRCGREADSPLRLHYAKPQ
jgi:hypothetical protein